MRDPNRIHEVITAVEALWNKYPDWRFMQLMNNLQRVYGNDMFYVEDDKFKDLIELLTEMGFRALQKGDNLWQWQIMARLHGKMAS